MELFFSFLAHSGSPGGDSSNPIYRVVGGRKHVQKSEAAMQTDTIKQSVQDHYDWKQVSFIHIIYTYVHEIWKEGHLVG